MFTCGGKALQRELPVTLDGLQLLLVLLPPELARRTAPADARVARGSVAGNAAHLALLRQQPARELALLAADVGAKAVLARKAAEAGDAVRHAATALLLCVLSHKHDPEFKIVGTSAAKEARHRATLRATASRCAPPRHVAPPRAAERQRPPMRAALLRASILPRAAALAGGDARCWASLACPAFATLCCNAAAMLRGGAAAGSPMDRHAAPCCAMLRCAVKLERRAAVSIATAAGSGFRALGE